MTRLLLVTGSTRRLSTNSAALRTARELLDGHATRVYEGLNELPAFNPDDDHETPPPVVRTFRSLIAEADALIFRDGAPALMRRSGSSSATSARPSSSRPGCACPYPASRSARTG